MVAIGIVGSICFGNLPELNNVILNEGSRAIEFTIGLAAIMALWMGIMNIARDSGLIDMIGQKMDFILKRLFPKIPKNHKAMSYIIMNIILNMLGAGNGATSFGLKAMEELQKNNPHKDTATNEMCSFLILNISSLQLIPINIIAYRSQYGSVNPTKVLIPGLIATFASTIVAVIYIKWKDRKR